MRLIILPHTTLPKSDLKLPRRGRLVHGMSEARRANDKTGMASQEWAGGAPPPGQASQEGMGCTTLPTMHLSYRLLRQQDALAFWRTAVMLPKPGRDEVNFGWSRAARGAARPGDGANQANGPEGAGIDHAVVSFG
jgi:hypothetical protein